MRNNNKNILIVSFSIFIIIFFVYFLFDRNINNEDQILQTLSVVSTVAPPEIEEKSMSLDEYSFNKEFEKTGKRVNIIVLEKEYEVAIKENDSVYEVMENLQKNKENNFNFSYKEYPSLGIFVNQINGIKGREGKYWIYSVNDQEALVGVSNYIVKDGDIIKWELK